MDSSERMPEERIGPRGVLLQRIVDVERLAAGCRAEANLRIEEANALRERADSLEESARAYRGWAAAGLSGRQPPADAHEGAVWMSQDPVDPTTFRRHVLDDGQWVRR